MGKRKQSITINGEYFIIENQTVTTTNLYARTLYKCYDRPSFAKIRIYDYWYDWFNDNGVKYLEHGIVSHNCMQFSYGGFVSLNGQLYYAHITKAYNRLYKVVTK